MATPKEEVEEVMNSGLSFGTEMLEKHGEFFPYGGAMTASGEVISVGGYTGEEQPPSQEVIELLRNGYRKAAESGEYKATALFYDVRVVPPESTTKSDAIAVELDHEQGYSVVVFFPYQLNSGKVIFGQVFAQQGANEIFQ